MSTIIIITPPPKTPPNPDPDPMLAGAEMPSEHERAIELIDAAAQSGAFVRVIETD